MMLDTYLPTQQPPTRAAGRILVVEDDALLSEVIETVLNMEGCEVVTAVDGAAALELIARFTPALILLDLHLAGLGGAEFARRYQETPPPHVPIILLTGSYEVDSDLAALGVMALLHKPFKVEDLLALVDRFAPCRSPMTRGPASRP